MIASSPPAAFAEAPAAALRWGIHALGTEPGFGGATEAPDGRSAWFSASNAVVQLGVHGVVRVIPVPYEPSALAFGGDGRLYTTICCTLSGLYAIMAVTPASGSIALYVPPSGDPMNPGVALGSDGNVWFTELTHVAKVEPSGTIVEYPITLPPNTDSNNVAGIIAGPDGKIWFPIIDASLGNLAGYFARIDPITGKMDETYAPCFNYPFVLGADHKVYAACRRFQSKRVDIISITAAGLEQIYPDPYGVAVGAQEFAATADGLIWAITFTTARDPNELSTLDPKTGKIVKYQTPQAVGPLSDLTLGPGATPWALSETDVVGIVLR